MARKSWSKSEMQQEVQRTIQDNTLAQQGATTGYSHSGTTYVRGGAASSGQSRSGGSSYVAPAPVFSSSLTGQSFSSAADRDKAESSFRAEQARQEEARKQAAIQRDKQIGVKTIGQPPVTDRGPAAAGAVTAKQIVEQESGYQAPSFGTLEDARTRPGKKIEDKVVYIPQSDRYYSVVNGKTVEVSKAAYDAAQNKDTYFNVFGTPTASQIVEGTDVQRQEEIIQPAADLVGFAPAYNVVGSTVAIAGAKYVSPLLARAAGVGGQFFDDISKAGSTLLKGSPSQAGTITQAAKPLVSQATKETAKKVLTSSTTKEAGKFVAGQATSAGLYFEGTQLPEQSRQLFDVQNPEQAEKFRKIVQSDDYKKAVSSAYDSAKVSKYGGTRVTDGVEEQVTGRENLVTTWVSQAFPAIQTADEQFVKDWQTKLKEGSLKDNPDFQKLSAKEKKEFVEQYATGRDLVYSQYGATGGMLLQEVAGEVGGSTTVRAIAPKVKGFGVQKGKTALLKGGVSGLYGAFGEAPSQYYTQQASEYKEVDSNVLPLVMATGGATGAFFSGVPSYLRGTNKEILEGLAEQTAKQSTKKASKETAQQTAKRIAKETAAKDASFKARASAKIIDVSGNILDLAEKPGDILGTVPKKLLGVDRVGILTFNVSPGAKDVSTSKTDSTSKESVSDKTSGKTDTKTPIQGGIVGVDVGTPPKEPGDVPPKPEEPGPGIPDKTDDDVPPEDEVPEQEKEEEKQDVPSQSNVSIETSTNIPIISAPGFGPPFMGLPFGSGKGTRKAKDTKFVNEIDRALRDVGVGVSKIQPKRVRKK